MKPIRINFIEDTRWRVLWLAVLACVLLGSGILTWQALRIQQTIQTTQARIDLLTSQLQKLSTPSAQPLNPQQTSASKALQLLQQDLNPLFTTVENIKEVGVRLRRLDLDAHTGSIGLEFELDSMLKANTVTTVLNAGYDNRPWQLGTITAPTGPTAGNSPFGFSSTPAVRAVWSTQLNKL